jgi:DNA-binding NtrC family response regulator
LLFQKPNVFIVYNNDDINDILAGTFWLKGLEPFKFKDGNECLKRLREMDGNVDVVLINQEIALDKDPMLIANIKRINPDTKIFAIAQEEIDKIKMAEYGADEVALLPLSPTDISDKLLLLISKGKLLERERERENDLI